jgi:hypothetical protein
MDTAMKIRSGRPRQKQDSAYLDDGDVWPVSYALMEWSPAAEKKVAELIKAAIS